MHDLYAELMDCTCRPRKKSEELADFWLGVQDMIKDFEDEIESLQVAHKLSQSLNETYRKLIADLENDIQNLKDRP